MHQEVKYLKVKDLVLWTENPRDPINENASDQEIVDKAINDSLSKWSLPKLAREMGEYYDFSELPTVVYHGKKPVVYDGNRRMILAKIKLGYVSAPNGLSLSLPSIPDEIPCNICAKKVALNNVYRKHSDTGSWLPLERDLFLHKFMGEEKSPFLILEEDMGLISANPHLNQRFVKEEIFREDNLEQLGFSISNGRLRSIHNDQETRSIFLDISDKISNKKISTRVNRGKVVETLEPSSQKLINENKGNKSRFAKVRFGQNEPTKAVNIPGSRLSRRTVKKDVEMFGGKLYLKAGEASNLYRDIVDLYVFYCDNKSHLSQTFPSLIRMSLRLLCETAAKDVKKRMDDYLKDNFETAKKSLDQDSKTTLSNHNVTANSIVQLLHTGAHNYQSSNNNEQMLAMSLIIGSILTTTHGK